VLRLWRVGRIGDEYGVRVVVIQGELGCFVGFSFLGSDACVVYTRYENILSITVTFPKK
jgi:hypothetical protein